MYNYYNIIPIILIHVFIIILFEGLLFYFYLLDAAEKTVSDQLSSYLSVVFTNLNKYQAELPLFQQTANNKITGGIHSSISEKITSIIEESKDKEEKHIQNRYSNGIKRFLIILGSILFLLGAYVFMVQYTYKKTIDWQTVFIVVGITIILIVIMEVLYVMMILFNKKFNTSEIQLAFIDALQN